MNINTLPDLCLLSVFRRLPSCDLLNIDLVCPRWASLQLVASRQRTSLTLLIGDKALPLITSSEFNCLNKLQNNSTAKFEQIEYLDSLDEMSTAKLCIVFSQITQLTVALYNVPMDALDSLTHYIHSSSSNLKTLKLFIMLASTSDTNRQFSNLLKTVNAQSSLTHFTLYIRSTEMDDYFFPTMVLPIELTILNQLYEFCFGVPDGLKMIVNTLQNALETNQNLTKLELGHFPTNVLKNDKVLNSSKFSLIPARITHLPLVQFSHPKWLQEFVLKFISIQSLTIHVESLLVLSRMLTILAQSPLSVTLNHLKIILILGKYSTENETLESPPRMIAIKNLTLRIINSHLDLKPIEWHRIFPNLEIIAIVRRSNCNLCTEKDGKECLKPMMKPFKKCTKLSAIYVRDQSEDSKLDFQLTVDEL